MRKKFFGTILAAAVLFNSSAFAEIKTFHEETSYIMNSDEPIRIAQDKVFKNAVRTISESVNLYIKSSSKMKNSNLDEDKIESFSAAVLKIKSKNFSKEYTPNNKLKITVTVEAEMDTNNVDELFGEILDSRNAVKNYDEILTDYTKRKNTFDTVYGDYINSFQKRVLQTIRAGCKLQNNGNFEEALKLYNAAIDETISEGAEISLAYVKRGSIYKIQGKNNLAMADFEKAVTLNNDSVGVHYAKAVLLELRGDKIQAAQKVIDWEKSSRLEIL